MLLDTSNDYVIFGISFWCIIENKNIFYVLFEEE
jgi:hypothetical protein